MFRIQTSPLLSLAARPKSPSLTYSSSKENSVFLKMVACEPGLWCLGSTKTKTTADSSSKEAGETSREAADSKVTSTAKRNSPYNQ